MKKFLTFILMIVLGTTLIGCTKIDFGIPDDLDPTENNEDVPVSVVLESVNKEHKLYIGNTLQLKATVSPNTVTEPVVFSSNNVAIATVDQQGLVTGVGEGSVKITAKVSKQISFNNTTTVEGYIVLTVMKNPVALTAVEITGVDSIFVEDNTKFEIVKTPANADAVGTWSTSDETIAKIDQNGNVTGLAAGEVEVKYFLNSEVNDTKLISVLNRDGSPASITTVVRDIIEVDEVVQAYIDVVPVGSKKTNIIWSSGNEEIATIDATGLITGRSEGKTTITAKLNDIIYSTVEVEIVDYRIDTSSLEQNIVDLVRTRKGAVLGVSNYKIDLEGDLVRNSLGSGFIYKVEFVLKNGSVLSDINDLRTFADVSYFKYYLITNRHVVEGSDALKIYMHEIDNEVPASLIQYDDKVDMSIVTFNYDKYIKPLTLANSDELVSGRFAIAIGNPSGYEFSSTATFGLISHPKRFLPTDTNSDGVNDWDSEYIQHDVAINPGNSGGPLFNLKGEVIGINTLKYVSDNIEGMGFSIPINVVKDLIPYLEDGEKPNRALLGVTASAVKDILDNPKSEVVIPEEIKYGLYVVNVSVGSVADIGGILIDDIIVKFGDIELTNVTMLRAELNQIIVGSNTVVEVVVYRNGEYQVLKLIF